LWGRSEGRHTSGEGGGQDEKEQKRGTPFGDKLVFAATYAGVQMEETNPFVKEYLSAGQGER